MERIEPIIESPSGETASVLRQTNNAPDSSAHSSLRESRGTIRRPDLVKLSLAALGVVFGDIGTSPLYAIREAFHGKYGIVVTPNNILGVLSLILWSLIIIVTIKYLMVILNADNNGEGGVIALTALLHQDKTQKNKSSLILVTVGLFAASLLYGDGMITPAISVLSAVEGVQMITHALRPYVIPLTVVILACLFFIQHRGTARVGSLFGPVILIWFVVIAAFGIRSIIKNPQILDAIYPWYGIHFLHKNGLQGFVVLGAVFLVVTGAEALYADLGHFGKLPIRMTWIALVFPALLLNYFGQGALLLRVPSETHHPFYALVPYWAMIPMVILATVATIIASQAVISGAFSLTRQAIQLGYLPRLNIVHTSAKYMGQVYVAPVNWLLMAATIALVLGFRSSSKLAAAYGVAVTSTMLISTILFYAVARQRWGWNRLTACVPAAFFLMVDLSFFSANLSKIFHGAWFPLVIGGAVFTLMIIWKKGRTLLAIRMKAQSMTFEELQQTLSDKPFHRVNGQAVYLTGNPRIVPAALVHNLNHNKVLHSEILFLHFSTAEVPRVPNDQKLKVSKLGGGFFKVVACYGFMENPNINNILSLAREKGLDFKLENASFFLGRQRLSVDETSGFHRWGKKIFCFLVRNAAEAAVFYDIPSERVIEVGLQLQI
jgi:KUP system potassium uptake protein